MAAERYRFVPFVRLLRRTRWASATLTLVIVGMSLVVNPLWSILTVLVGVLAAMLSQARMLDYGDVDQAWLRGFQPALLLSTLGANFLGVLSQTAPSPQMSQLALVAPALIALGSWYIGHQRTQQGLISLRDFLSSGLSIRAALFFCAVELFAISCPVQKKSPLSEDKRG